MDTPWISIVSQCGVYLTFALYLAWTLRRGAREWAPLLSACGYAVLFEHWNMLRYAHSQGGYHYNIGSWVWVWGDVPLYIPLAWAFILGTSRALTDQMHLPLWAKPFADALLALLIDASMDAVAIRLHFWYWHGVGINDGFFGVPADNFVGWLLVSFTFSALTRWLWMRRSNGNLRDSFPPTPPSLGELTGCPSAPIQAPHPPILGEVGWSPRIGAEGPIKKYGPALKVAVQIVLLPPIAYVAYLGLEGIVHLQYALFHAATLRGQLIVLAGNLLLFIGVVLAGMRHSGNMERPADEAVKPGHVEHAFVHGPRHIFHLFGLIGLLCVPAALRTPALWALAAGVWAIEWTVALIAARSARPKEGM